MQVAERLLGQSALDRTKRNTTRPTAPNRCANRSISSCPRARRRGPGRRIRSALDRGDKACRHDRQEDEDAGTSAGHQTGQGARDGSTPAYDWPAARSTRPSRPAVGVSFEDPRGRPFGRSRMNAHPMEKRPTTQSPPRACPRNLPPRPSRTSRRLRRAHLRARRRHGAVPRQPRGAAGRGIRRRDDERRVPGLRDLETPLEEELGGPFIETTAAEELAYDDDGIVGPVSAEPFPRHPGWHRLRGRRSVRRGAGRAGETW